MAILDTTKQTPQEIAEILRAENLFDKVMSIEEHESVITIEKDAQGRRKTWTEVRGDTRRVDSYTYYPTGEVNVIKQHRYEGEKLVQDVEVKHYLDNTRPTVTAIPVKELLK